MEQDAKTIRLNSGGFLFDDFYKINCKMAEVEETELQYMDKKVLLKIWVRIGIETTEEDSTAFNLEMAQSIIDYDKALKKEGK